MLQSTDVSKKYARAKINKIANSLNRIKEMLGQVPHYLT
jgi:hypothetical protein